MIIYFRGFIDVQTFEKEARDNQLEPNKVVFLFPGNSSHHGLSNNLFSVKSGGGLAVPAGHLGRKGYPVLSLPTTSMESWSTNKLQQQTVETAIADLYRAAGAGFSFLLPIRGHNDTKYFDEGLAYSNGLMEPSFWGQNAPVGNKPLAIHYTKALDDLHQFLALSEQDRVAKAKSNPTLPYYAAFLHGQNMQADDPWLKEGKPSVTPRITLPKKEEEPPLPVVGQIPPILPKKQLPIPDSYQEIYKRGNGNLVMSARAILDDYTKGDCTILRFLYGHWNRHHTFEVAQIVKKIDKAELNTPKLILAELNKIKLANTEGSLARRISFLKQQFEEGELTKTRRPG